MANFPVFQFNQSAFPMLTPQQTSPFGGVLADAIKKRLAIDQEQKAAVEAKYAERKTLADILHQEMVNKYLPQTTEASLLSSKLSSRKSQLEIEKALMDLDQEKQFRKLFNQSLKNNNVNVPSNNIMDSTVQPSSPEFKLGNNQSFNIPGSENLNINTSLPLMPNEKNNLSQIEIPKTNNVTSSDEKIISQGSPNLYNIDSLYDNNPVARSFLEKRGFKKTQQVKIDKVGNPTIVTRYPSGKVTIQSQSNTGDAGIPLTTTQTTKHQNVVSSVDVAVPILDKIIKLSDSEYSRFGGWTNKGAKYKALVSQGLDSILGAFGLPQTDKGLQSIYDQLEIGHFESPEAYRERIKELKKDILKRQKYSASLIKKSIKTSEDKEENDPYDLDKYDSSGE